MWLAAAGPAPAHNLAYALGRLQVTPDGGWRLEVACHTAALVLGAQQGHLRPEAQAALEAMPADEVRMRAGLMADYVRRATVVRVNGRQLAPSHVDFPTVDQIREDGRMTPATARPSAPIVLRGRLPPGARALSIALPPEVGVTLLRIDGGSSQALAPAQASVPIAVDGPSADPGRTLLQYLALGFEHIVPKGLDHILFIMALFLLAPRLQPLTWQVTGFTVAHSITLALAAFDVIALPAKLVEVAIAVSIVALALDNLRAHEPSRWRALTVFGFGLLHGMGFASVLRDLGLPRGQGALALAGFNLGIEGGQLAVLLGLFLASGWWIGRSWYRARITVPASIAIAVVAGVWTVERAFA